MVSRSLLESLLVVSQGFIQTLDAVENSIDCVSPRVVLLLFLYDWGDSRCPSAWRF